METCSENKVILIFDEVMTGFRISLAEFSKKQNYSDLTAMGKIIGGGLPVGAFGGRSDIMDTWPHLVQFIRQELYGTHCNGRRHCILKLLRKALLMIFWMNWATGSTGVKHIADQYSIPLQVPQVGSMFSLFFSEKPVHNFEDALASNADQFKHIFQICLKNGVYLPPSAYETCFISTAHEKIDITNSLEKLEKAFSAI